MVELTEASDDASYSLPDFAALFAEFGDRLRGGAGDRTIFEALVALAIEMVPGAEYAGVTLGAADRFVTEAATDDVVRQVDRIQYELQSGPCVAAALDAAVYNSPDITTDERWREFGIRAHAETGIRSMYAARLFMESDGDLVAALNFYSRDYDAFGPNSEAAALILSTHAAYAIAHKLSQARVENLEKALLSNRDIGVAVGVLMSQHKVTRDQALDLLKVHSQRSQRRLAELAGEVIETGALPPLPVRPNLR